MTRGALLLLCGMGITSSALAQDLQEGRAHLAEARFEDAQAAFERVLADPALTRRAAVEAHRELASLRAAFGDMEAASAHAMAARSLDPQADPPPTASPDARALFVDVPRARIEIEVRGRAMEARLVDAPPALALSLRVTCADRDVPVVGGVAHHEAGPTEGGCVARALTRAGAELLREEMRFEALALETASPRPTSRQSPWPWLLGAAAGALGVLLVVLSVGLARRPDGARFDPVTIDW